MSVENPRDELAWSLNRASGLSSPSQRTRQIIAWRVAARRLLQVKVVGADELAGNIYQAARGVRMQISG